MEQLDFFSKTVNRPPAFNIGDKVYSDRLYNVVEAEVREVAYNYEAKQYIYYCSEHIVFLDQQINWLIFADKAQAERNQKARYEKYAI